RPQRPPTLGAKGRPRRDRPRPDRCPAQLPPAALPAPSARLAEHRPIELEGVVDHCVPAETLACARTCRATEPLPELRVPQEPFDRLAQCGHVAWRDE